MTEPAQAAPGARRAGDRLEVRGLRVLGVHGVLASERSAAQPFELDLDVVVDTAPAARTDQLADTVDYADLSLRAADVVERRSYSLLETLADAVANEILGADDRIEFVGVTVRKLHPPVALALTSVGVRVVRFRG